jgi:hypothetical protein
MYAIAPTFPRSTPTVDHKEAIGGTFMTLEQDIAAIRDRIAKAEADRDAWRAAGLQEKYLEACGLVDRLERQFDARLRQAGDRTARAPGAAAGGSDANAAGQAADVG